jgi:L-asparaginase
MLSGQKTPPHSITGPVHIKIFSVGGTIDKIYFDAKSNYEVGDPQVLEIFDEARVTFDYEIEPLMHKDSLDMTEEDRVLIRQRIENDPCSLIVLTHGTDTMTKTAAALEDIPGKVIVLTGSMTPFRFRGSDAEFNIGCAVGAVQSLPPGVYIAMNGRVFASGSVKKDREKRVFEEAENDDLMSGELKSDER